MTATVFCRDGRWRWSVAGGEGTRYSPRAGFDAEADAFDSLSDELVPLGP